MVTISQLKAKHKTMCNEALELVVKRGSEYAPDEDTLKTFRSAARISDMKHGSSVCFNMISVKVSRILEQVVKGKVPTDSLLDLINYSIYLQVLLEEENLEKTGIRSE